MELDLPMGNEMYLLGPYESRKWKIMGMLQVVGEGRILQKEFKCETFVALFCH